MVTSPSTGSMTWMALRARVKEAGFEMDTNWYVSMDTPTDRFVSVAPVRRGASQAGDRRLGLDVRRAPDTPAESNGQLSVRLAPGTAPRG